MYSAFTNRKLSVLTIKQHNITMHIRQDYLEQWCSNKASTPLFTCPTGGRQSIYKLNVTRYPVSSRRVSGEAVTFSLAFEGDRENRGFGRKPYVVIINS